MQGNIPIKIKPNSQPKNRDIKNALNLNQAILEKQQYARPNKKNRLWPVLAIIFFLAGAGLAAKTFWLDKNEFSSYNRLIPEQAQAATIVNLSSLSAAARPIASQFNLTSNFDWLSWRVQRFFSEAKINAKSDLLPLFESNALVLLMPSETNISWGMIVQVKQEQNAQAEPVFSKIEQQLKKDFGQNQQTWRQVQINSAFSLSQIDKLYYWSRIDKFVLISNSLSAMEKMIDKLIGK